MTAAFLLLALLVANFFTGNFSFFAGTSLGTDIWFIFGFILLIGACRKIGPAHLVVSQLLLAAAFLVALDGQLLFTDDHPSFFYRLVLLKEHFPYIPFYNTDWNAGYDGREFFPSGVLNVYFLAAPILYLTNLLESTTWYNYLIAYLYIFLVPAFTFAAALLLRFSKTEAAIAGILVLAPNYEYFRWLLQYGTLGFLLSVGVLPVTFALAYRIALDPLKPHWSFVPALLVASALTLFWSLSFIPLLPITFVDLCSPRQLLASWKYITAFVVLFILVNHSWIITFITESKVGSYLQTATHGESRIKGSGLENLLGNLTKFHPLLIAAGFFAHRRKENLILMLSAFFCILVAAWGPIYKPQLELDRMVLPASAFLALTAAQVVSRFITYRFAGSLFGATLVAGVLLGAAVYSNHSSVRYKVAERDFAGLIELINKSDSDGRVFFSGFILHELEALNYASQDGGHVAPLPLFTGRQMYASHFYHARWKSVDPIPASYRRRGAEGVEEFLDLINVSTMVTFSHPWANYCKNSERYTQVGKVGRFRVFERRRQNPGWVSSGEADVELAERGLRVTLGSKEAVLRYRHQKRLKVLKGDAELEKVEGYVDDFGEHFDFIRLRTSTVPQVVELGY